MSDHTRRKILKAAGASTVAVAVAGCLGGDENGNGGNGNGDDGGDDGGGSDGIEIEPGTEIVLDGYSTHWEGLEPSEIDGEENPTLVLTEGEAYTMEWINADDMPHDLQIWDDDDEVVDDLISDEVDTEGERASIEFTASSEMVTYVCSYHAGNQIGDLVVE